MPPSQMLPSVLQALALSGLNAIASHHLMTNVWEDATQSELFTNYTKAMRILNDARNSTTNSTADFLRAMNETIANTTWTVTNVTFTHHPTATPDSTLPKSFYRHTLPRSLFISLVLTLFLYHWHLWLERTFPARTRPGSLPPEKAAEAETDESREEAVVRRWIAQGKVKRASLNWGNTFVKWLLHLTLGILCVEVLYFLMNDVLLEWSLSNFRGDKRRRVKWVILLRCVYSYFDIWSVTSLISFIVVPAHKRVVFMAGADLLWSLSVGLLLKRVVPMLLSNHRIQEILREMTEKANRQNAKPVVLNEVRPADEL